jgi:hypothetical protein
VAFLVEDGTGLAGSTSYVAVATATSYHADRGNTAWAAIASDALRQVALIRASQAIDHMGQERFPGTRHSTTQGLDWPRDDAYDLEGNELTLVPTPVVNATCEGALLEAATPGILSPSLERGGRIKLERVEGAVTVEYDTSAPSTTNYTTVTRALAPVLNGSGLGVVRV